MKRKSMTLAALALAFSSSLEFAHPITNTGAHQRPNLFHDRSPKPHSHSSVAHH
jgi:hypothetical protein